MISTQENETFVSVLITAIEQDIPDNSAGKS
jgi:hypothetical protein